MKLLLGLVLFVVLQYHRCRYYPWVVVVVSPHDNRDSLLPVVPFMLSVGYFATVVLQASYDPMHDLSA